MKIREFLQQKREDILQIADQHGAFNVRIFGSVANQHRNRVYDYYFWDEIKTYCSEIRFLGLCTSVLLIIH